MQVDINLVFDIMVDWEIPDIVSLRPWKKKYLLVFYYNSEYFWKYYVDSEFTLQTEQGSQWLLYTRLQVPKKLTFPY